MKFSKRQLAVFFTIVLSVGLFVGAKTLLADTGSNTSGYAWSSNIGWISSNNCTNPSDASTCSGSSYGVSMMAAAPGTISGYGWSSNIGWITFNNAGCPTTGCTPGARVDWANKNSDGSVNIKGWARACSVYASGCSGALKSAEVLGGWDGYIALDSVSGGGAAGAWGWKVGAGKEIAGFAWGSDVIGWVKSISMSLDGSSVAVDLKANPTTIARGAKSTLTVTATNIDGPNACTGLPSPVTMVQSGGAWTGSIQVSPFDTTDYTVTCSKGLSTATDAATVTVTYFNTPTDPTSGGGTNGNGLYCAITNPQFAWSSNASSCTITRQGGASQTVGGTSKASGGTIGVDGLYYFTPNLPVQGSASTYTLQCGSGATGLTLTATVPRCVPDYAVVATPNSKTLADLGEEGKVSATFNITVKPINGFTGPVDLSVATWPATIPSSKTGVFSPVTLTSSGGTYGTSSFTVTVDVKDLKTSTTYSPLIIQGKGNGLTRQASVSVGADVKTKPVYEDF